MADNMAEEVEKKAPAENPFLKGPTERSVEVDLFTGEAVKETGLVKQFVIPPLSVFNTRSGYWQDRKDEWKKITGNLSETRTGDFGGIGGSKASDLMAQINGGTSNFDPVLAEIMFKWFCPPGGRILDPFGGEQTKGVVAGTLGYTYHAVEFRKEQVDLNTEKCAHLPSVKYWHGDSNNIDKIIPERGYNFVFTSPPYYDLEIYSKEDMSALGTYEEFMAQYKNIFARCVDMMADDGFLAVKVGEIRDRKTGMFRNFVGDNTRIFLELGLKFYNEMILVAPVGTACLRSYTSFKTRKITKTHQNVLVFVKGDIEKIIDNMPDINFKEADYAID